MSCSCGEGQCLRPGSIGCQQAPQQTSCSLRPVKLQQQRPNLDGTTRPTIFGGDDVDDANEEFGAGL